MGKIVKDAFANFLIVCLIFTLVTGWFYSGWPRIWEKPTIPPEVQEAQAAADTIEFITDIASTTWTVPSNWTASNTIEVIGGGGGGRNSANGAGGGGGGAYAMASNTASLNPGDTVYIQVGSGGAKQTNGDDTWFYDADATSTACGNQMVCAPGGLGTGGTSGGAGGASTTAAIGEITYLGGDGGTAGGATGDCGGGGGGAAGPNGNGGNGGNCSNTADRGGGGGGGNGGGSNGAAGGASANGGAGGDSCGAACNGAAGDGGDGGVGGTGTAGLTGGGGGGGADGYDGGSGGNGAEWVSYGSGGGGGGWGDSNASTSATDNGSGGLYGGGGGGGPTNGKASASGSRGIIRIVYTPNNAPSITNDTEESEDPVLQGNPVTFTATSTDSESDGWWLAVCKTDAVTAGSAGAAPACNSEANTYCTSTAAVASGVQNTCTWTSSGTGAQNWYSFACDNNSITSYCSATSTANSPITVEAPTISVSLDTSIYNYGTMAMNSTASSTVLIATNDGSSTENFDIIGNDAATTSPYMWELSTSSTGTDIYVHAYTTDSTEPSGTATGTDPAVGWVALDTGNVYNTLATGVLKDGTVQFYLDMRTPATAGASTTYGTPYETTVTVRASAP